MDHKALMRKFPSLASLLLFGSFVLVAPVLARKPAQPLAWTYNGTASAPVLAKPGNAKAKKRGEFERGALAELMEEKSSKGEAWWEVRFVNPETLLAVEGWVKARGLTQIPYDRYPSDSDLLTKMGAPYLEDFVASHTVIARYLMHQGPGNPMLIGYVGSRVLPQARLQIFREAAGEWNAGPHLEFSYVDMSSPLTKIEVGDLFGNQHECLISTEKSEPGPGATLTREVIRNVAGESIQTLWDAPTQWSALGSYPAKMDVLSPPVMNIGRPGTVTTGKVTFQSQSGTEDPVWDGKVDFFVLGRKKPVQTVPIHKVCLWTGEQFEPLRPDK